MSSPVRQFRPRRSAALRSLSVRRGGSRRAGYTLIEIITATVLCLLIMAAVTSLIGSVTTSIAESRGTIEMADQLRSAQIRLQTDLRYRTAPMTPSLRPSDSPGYFEIIEGPGPFIVTGQGVVYGDSTVSPVRVPDSSIGDLDDILMWTVRSYGEPFSGRVGGAGSMGQSQVAEVAWFVRGTTLYRRVLLVLPKLNNGLPRTYPNSGPPAFYDAFDVSVRHEMLPDTNGNLQRFVIGNSLSDLTNRQNRFAHYPFDSSLGAGYGFPHDIRQWGILGLPTMRETSHSNWTVPFPNVAMPQSANFDNRNGDMWINQYAAWNGNGSNADDVDPDLGNMPQFAGPRLTEDVILSHVIGFDVQVWDPNAPVFDVGTVLLTPGEGRFDAGSNRADAAYLAALERWINADFPMPITRTGPGHPAPVGFGAYVNLFWLRRYPSGVVNAYLDASLPNPQQSHPIGHFASAPNPASQLTVATLNQSAIWDTWSTHYETDGIDQNGNNLVDEGNDGVDNAINGPANGIVDDAVEMEAPPPYAAPIRALRVRLRVFDPDTKHIREVTVEQDFVK